MTNSQVFKESYTGHHVSELESNHKLLSEAIVISPDTVEDSILNITRLPPEIHLLILDYLRPASSACLGVTCKAFYSTHRKVHGKVSLTMREVEVLKFGNPPLPVVCKVYAYLHVLLRDWMGDDRIWDDKHRKFTPKAIQICDYQDRWTIGIRLLQLGSESCFKLGFNTMETGLRATTRPMVAGLRRDCSFYNGTR